MTLIQWFIFFLVVQVIHFLGTWKLYKKAGRQAWEAIIPVYNAVILMKIIGRPWWWTILLFIPIVNLIMFPVVWVETARSFGKNTTTDTVLVLITLGFYLYYINYMQDVTYREDRSLVPKSTSGEWVSSILFAVVAATIVHTYVMQPFTIPTGSLERTLLIGDFLFVSKFHYGARTPMTTVSFPMVHDTIPKLGVKSYLGSCCSYHCTHLCNATFYNTYRFLRTYLVNWRFSICKQVSLWGPYTHDHRKFPNGTRHNS